MQYTIQRTVAKLIVIFHVLMSIHYAVKLLMHLCSRSVIMVVFVTGYSVGQKALQVDAGFGKWVCLGVWAWKLDARVQNIWDLPTVMHSESKTICVFCQLSIIDGRTPAHGRKCNGGLSKPYCIRFFNV